MKSKRTLYLVVVLLLAGSIAGCGIDISQLARAPSTATATLEAAVLPAPTPEPTSPPTETPTPVRIPPRPYDLEHYPETIVRYLNDSGGDEDGLRDMLGSWDALRQDMTPKTWTPAYCGLDFIGI